MPRSLATRIRAAATSRTWLTLPGEPSTSALAMVCTESTTSRSGLTASTWPSTAARSVSAARKRSSRRAPMRSARSRTWAADSSPVTYSARPRSANRAATSSSSVDFPTPGSPASSTTAPGTRPPPSTRSSSSTPVRIGPGRPRRRPRRSAAPRSLTGPAVVVRTAGAAASTHRAPGLALAAPADPLGRGPAALRAAEGRALAGRYLGHATTVGRTSDTDREGARQGLASGPAEGLLGHALAEEVLAQAGDQRLDLAGHGPDRPQLGLEQLALEQRRRSAARPRGVHGGSAPMKTLNSSSGAR